MKKTVKTKTKNKIAGTPYVMLIKGDKDVTLGLVNTKSITLSKEQMNQIIFLYISFAIPKP